MGEFRTLVISEVKKETPNSVSIRFEIPENLRETFAFKAGQYITIKHFDGSKEIRRAYSICSSPNSGQLRVGVKRVEKGAFSQFANEKLKAGDSLEVMPPTGKFLLEPNLKHYAAFAAGSGITPVLSLIKSTLEDMPQSAFLLIYGNKSLEETMFYDEIVELKSRYPKRFIVEFLFS